MVEHTNSDHEVIYLAPPCHGQERMWCEDADVVDCECLDGPHSWIKYTRQPPSIRNAVIEECAAYVRSKGYARLELGVDKTGGHEATLFTEEGYAALTQGKPDVG